MNQQSRMYDLALGIFEAMNSRDFSAFEQIVTDDVSLDFPGVDITYGSRRTILLMKAVLRKYPRLTFTVSDVIQQEKRACAVWTNEGEDSSGNHYSNSGITLIQFAGGKISFISDYFKDTSFTDSPG